MSSNLICGSQARKRKLQIDGAWKAPFFCSGSNASKLHLSSPQTGASNESDSRFMRRGDCDNAGWLCPQ
jgi:hypothetical protein